MAVGYSHTPVVAALLAAGADPEVRDAQGRDVVGLVESLRAGTPPVPELMARRVALEQAASLLAGVWLDLGEGGGGQWGRGQWRKGVRSSTPALCPDWC